LEPIGRILDRPQGYLKPQKTAMFAKIKGHRRRERRGRRIRLRIPQSMANHGNSAQARAYRRDDIGRDAGRCQRSLRKRFIEIKEKTMKTLINSALGSTVRWTLLPAIAVSALLVGLPAVQAQDFNQQATSAEKDDATNWGAAIGRQHAYARAPSEFQRAPRHFRKHRDY
jgi:hypothetical protein